MNHLVFGSNTPAIADLGELLYSGQNGDAAEKAIADNRDKYAVIRRTLQGFEAFLRMVQQYDANHPAVKKEEPAPAAEAPPTPEPEAEPQVTAEPKRKRSPKK